MNTLKRFRKYHLPLQLTLLAAVLLAGAVTLLALWCQPNALRIVVSHLLAQPLLIVLNAMPVGLLVLLFTCLFRNVFYSAALVNLAVCGLSIANRIKLEVRDEPVFPRDFALLKEVGSAVGAYDIRFPAGAILLVLFVTLALAALGVVIGCRPFPVEKLRGWLGRLVGAAGSFAVLVVLILTVYASNDLYNSFRVSNAYYIPSVFNELGFPYCFCHQFTTYPIDRPAGFDKSAAIRWDEEETEPDEEKAVNVIMIMNEGFSDITDEDAFAFTDETEPLPTLQALRQDPHALTGHLVVPAFAGGTANTEFDVLTGMQTNGLAATGNTSAMRVVNRKLDSLYRVFGADGYSTSYIHCGDNWFYNRENVMRWMGAEESLFIKQMRDVEYKGRWVTDDYMAGLIETEFEDAVAENRRLFTYVTTIQNHMSYTADKYGADYEYPAVELSREVTDDMRTMLEVYVEGARDADAMLGRLVDYFTDRDEPVVLVFFGDHLPYLGDNQRGYTELGIDVASGDASLPAPMRAFETPYVIWANDAAADTLDWESAAKALELPENGQLSASFLGAAVLELTGRGEDTAWFRFLNTLRRELPVVQKNVSMLPDGTYADEHSLSSEIASQLLKWRQWSYYKLRYKDINE